MIERATPFAYYPGCSLLTCSAEDLIILKAFANRLQDWIDIEGIIMRQGAALDATYIIEQLTPLCESKDNLDIINKIKNLIARNQNER
ncbi:MAG: hypothetical protein JRJ27_11720 [Deltaproteobacteria bacterium]|nr:hypothetical protein [Deltaproteobacteria bacterium]